MGRAGRGWPDWGWARERLDAMTPEGHDAIIHVTLTDDHPWAQARPQSQTPGQDSLPMTDPNHRFMGKRTTFSSPSNVK